MLNEKKILVQDTAAATEACKTTCLNKFTPNFKDNRIDLYSNCTLNKKFE